MYDCQWSQQKNICKSQIGQDQVSGGVSVLCWHAAPVAGDGYHMSSTGP